MRYPLVHPQGSLGTQEDNDLVASSRYTEAKPSIYADLMMLDYKKNPVPVKETYNGEFMEPVVLPALFPNALCNGRQAIGIAMAHSSVPHNLTEVCNAILAYIKNPNLTIDDIMQYIKGPDFPLRNTIINQKDIRTALATGKSNTSLKVRGDYTIDGNKIIFTTIPYRTYRNKIKEQLEKNVDEFETCMEDFNDESNIGENRIVFFAKPGKVQALLNKLFKYTDLQTTVSYNMNYIVNGTPKLCSIKDLIIAYVQHQNNVMVNIAKTNLEKATARERVLEGLLIAIKDIDTAIQVIKGSDDKEAARAALVQHFNITEVQANAVLDMKLAKLTKLDKDDLLKELEELRLAIVKYNRIINEQSYRDEVLSEQVTSLRDKYGDERRTIITQINDNLSDGDTEITNVEPEKCIVIVTEAGTIKRIPTSSYKAQRRNGKGTKTQEDITSAIIRTNTIDNLMIFSNKGQMYRLLVDNIPAGTNSSKGQSIRALVDMEPDEEFAAMYSIYRDTDAQYVVFVTQNGLIKKTKLEEYIKTKKKTGMGAINLREGDRLVSVSLVKDENISIITKKGFVVKFKLSEVSPTSRLTSGVKAINLSKDDIVVAALPVRNENDSLALFTRRGIGKKIPSSESILQSRGGRGLNCYKNAEAEGGITAAALVSDEDNLLVVGIHNNICISAQELAERTRPSSGTQILKNDQIISVTKI